MPHSASCLPTRHLTPSRYPRASPGQHVAQHQHAAARHVMYFYSDFTADCTPAETRVCAVPSLCARRDCCSRCSEFFASKYYCTQLEQVYNARAGRPVSPLLFTATAARLLVQCRLKRARTSGSGCACGAISLLWQQASSAFACCGVDAAALGAGCASHASHETVASHEARDRAADGGARTRRSLGASAVMI